ncbi:hypothetical protein ACIQU5_31510 [Streptomyces sp. NPDC090306]|uniref:hypothetical protein n=1 Tax=Streptomyces sp. NPDC090306 TaxID=3365961 RepID=UPI0037FADAD2
MYDQTRAQQPPDQPRGSTGHRAQVPEPLVPSAGRADLDKRLGHALNIFADSPREALQEAETVFDEATALLVTALAERREALRAGWNEGGDDADAQSDEYRLALRQYREVTQRLLRM